MKRYLGKGQQPIQITRAGVTTQGYWVTRHGPVEVRDQIAVQSRHALTYAHVETGDTITEAEGQRWSVISVQFTKGGETDPGLFDLKLGAIL